MMQKIRKSFVLSTLFLSGLINFDAFPVLPRITHEQLDELYKELDITLSKKTIAEVIKFASERKKIKPEVFEADSKEALIELLEQRKDDADKAFDIVLDFIDSVLFAQNKNVSDPIEKIIDKKISEFHDRLKPELNLIFDHILSCVLTNPFFFSGKKLVQKLSYFFIEKTRVNEIQALKEAIKNLKDSNKVLKDTASAERFSESIIGAEETHKIIKNIDKFIREDIVSIHEVVSNEFHSYLNEFLVLGIAAFLQWPEKLSSQNFYLDPIEKFEKLEIERIISRLKNLGIMATIGELNPTIALAKFSHAEDHVIESLDTEFGRSYISILLYTPKASIADRKKIFSLSQLEETKIYTFSGTVVRGPAKEYDDIQLLDFKAACARGSFWYNIKYIIPEEVVEYLNYFFTNFGEPIDLISLFKKEQKIPELDQPETHDELEDALLNFGAELETLTKKINSDVKKDVVMQQSNTRHNSYAMHHHARTKYHTEELLMRG